MATSMLQTPLCVGQSSFAHSASISRPKSSRCSASLAHGGRIIRNSSRIKQSRASTTLSLPSNSLGFLSSSITETRLRGTQLDSLNLEKGCGGGGALGAVCYLPASPEALRWVFVAAASVLLFVKNAGIQKQFLVPLVALQIPHQAIGWIKGDYGLWAGFLALAVKLFYQLPGELELPLYLLLLVVTAPFQLTQYRGSTAAAVAALGVGAYLSYQHYQSTGSLKGAFQGEKIFPSIAFVILLIVPTLFLVNGLYY